MLTNHSEKIHFVHNKQYFYTFLWFTSVKKYAIMQGRNSNIKAISGFCYDLDISDTEMIAMFVND